MRWTAHVAFLRERRVICRVFVRTPEGKKLLGRSRRRWEDNIRMDYK
jgi:hypothetical protein